MQPVAADSAGSRQLRDIHPLHPLARPRRLAQKRETGFDAWIVEETAHRQAPAELNPPVAFNHAVQGIAGMGIRHDVMVYSMEDERRANGLPCSFITAIRSRTMSELRESSVANMLDGRALPMSASIVP